MSDRMSAKFDANHEYTKWDVLYNDRIPTMDERIQRPTANKDIPSWQAKSAVVAARIEEDPESCDSPRSRSKKKVVGVSFAPALCMGHGISFDDEDTAVRIPPDRGGAFLVLEPKVTSRLRFSCVFHKAGLSMVSMGFVEPGTVLRPDIDLSSVSQYVIGDDPSCAYQYYNHATLNMDGHTSVHRDGVTGLVTITASLEAGGTAVTMGGVPRSHRFVVAMNVAMLEDRIHIV